MAGGLATAAWAAVTSLTLALAPAGGDKFGLLPPQIDGPLEDHWRETLEKRLAEGLARSDAQPIPSSSVMDVVKNAGTCETASCFIDVANRTGADYLISLSVTVAERDFTTRLRLVDGRTGSILAATDQKCEMCGISEVGDLLSDQGASLVSKLQSLAERPAYLVVETMPSGATVWIDDRPIGPTPLRTKVEPGPHQVHVERRGYEPRGAQMETPSGLEQIVHFHLDTSMKRILHMRAWGWTSLGIGLGSIVGGGVLLGIHEKPYKRQCSDDNVDEVGRCRFRFNTVAAGSLLTTAGVGLVALGIALLLTAKKRKSKLPPAPQPKRKADTGRRFTF